jgi:hypothetical protein
MICETSRQRKGAVRRLVILSAVDCASVAARVFTRGGTGTRESDIVRKEQR